MQNLKMDGQQCSSLVAVWRLTRVYTPGTKSHEASQAKTMVLSSYYRRESPGDYSLGTEQRTVHTVAGGTIASRTKITVPV